MNYSPNLLKILGIRMATAIINAKCSEQKLFQAIIVQAFEDCVTPTCSKVDAYNKEDSYNWFKDDSEDFKTICWYADMDPDFVKSRFNYLNEQGQIKFTKGEKMWMEYRAKYKAYRAANTIEERRKIKKNIDKIDIPGAEKKK